MAEHVVVAFAGEGSGSGELTWGQRAAWRTFLADGEAKTLGGVVPAAAGTTVQQVAESLRFALSRHQALRTRLRFQPDGDVRQELSASGEALLELVDVPPGRDPAEVAEEVHRRFVTEPFDYERDWPVRMAAVRRDGEVTHTVAVYLQTALDAYGLAALARDLLSYLSGAPVEPVTAIQPLELAARQAGPVARRQGAASLRHMEQVLASVPLRRWPDPVRPGAPPDWDTLVFRSPALAAAAAAVSARRGIDTSPILLGAYAVGLATMTGVSPVAILVAVNNRFRPRTAASVSPMAQVGTCLIDVTGTLDEVVGRAWQAALSAYKHAYYHPAERSAVARRLGATAGGPRDLSCYFNDRRGQGLTLEEPAGPVPPAADPDAARDRSTLRWDLQPGFPQETAYLNVDEVPGAIQLSLTVDLNVLPRETTERLVRALEEAAVGMALRPDAPTGIRAAVPAVAR